MELKQLAPGVWYRPHEPERDRPMLCYIRGGRYALAVDAGYSRAQVQDFYRLLGAAGLPLPDFTAITHWHFDHTLGMAHIHGASVASQATNAHLRAGRRAPGSPAAPRTCGGRTAFLPPNIRPAPCRRSPRRTSCSGTG